MLAKAATLAADEVLIDLEDAVTPLEKNDATRQQVVDALLGLEWRAGTRAVRVNDVEHRWCFRDIAYVVERLPQRLDCIILPKVETAADVHFADRLLSQLELELGPRVASASRCRSRVRAGS